MLATKWRSWGTRLGLVSFIAMGGVIAVFGDCVLAQITPDGTLGAESSVVTPTNIDELPTQRIDGGATRGANLFHSFDAFSVPTGSVAHFNNTLDIQNIFSRVTGESISNIDGLIRANGTANLFLLNPNGIIFGPNASLNIGGSFLGSTASSLNFADGNQFSATAPQTTPLLSVNVPIGLQYGVTTPGMILNQSQATNSSNEVVGLQVQSGRSLALVGGNVLLESGNLTAKGGRIEIGSVMGAGEVNLSQVEKGLVLDYDKIDFFGEIRLENTAVVDVTSGGGGIITFTAQDINVLGNSLLVAGIDSGLVGSQAGDIKLKATESVTIANSSEVTNAVFSEVVGNAGNVTIETKNLNVSNSQVSSISYGKGNAGNLTIFASNSVVISGEMPGSDGEIGFPGGLLAQVDFGAEGQAGNLTIETGRLSVSNGSKVQAATFGDGDAGSLLVRAPEIDIFNTPNSNNFFSTGVFTGLQLDPRNVRLSRGNGGNLTIETERLSVRDGAVISVETIGQGNAGSLLVQATDLVEVVGTDQYGSSFLGADVRTEAAGSGGEVTIKTKLLSIRDGGLISSSTFGEGDAGSLLVQASDSVEVVGTDADGYGSYLGAGVGVGARGDGGNLTVETGRLSIRDGAFVSTSTFGIGNAGDLTVRANDSVEVVATDAEKNPSSLSAQVDLGAEGNAGDLTITTGRLLVRDGAFVSASTFGTGDGGTLSVTASDAVEVIGTSADGQFFSGLFAQVAPEATGNGGNLTIETGRLIVQDSAEVNVSSQGLGDAGNLEVVADSIRLDNQAAIYSNTTKGQGNIFLRSGDLVLRRESSITTNATGIATGGNITIDTGVLAALENSDITANAGEASGGQVRINAQGIFGTEFRNQPTSKSDITARSNLGPQFSGIVEINTSNVDLNQGLITLPVELVNVEGLIANSCIARSGEQKGNFNITGAGGLPTRPGDAYVSPYPTSTVRSIPSNDASPSSSQTSPVQSTNKSRRWKMGDPIVEPQGVYRLANGELVMSRECSHQSAASY